MKSAIVNYAKDLLDAGILPHDMPVQEAIERVNIMVGFGVLVPCFTAFDDVSILFVPRSTTAYGGPFDPLTMLAPLEMDALE